MLVSLALLLQSLLPLGEVWSAPAGASAPLLICTAAGFKTIAGDDRTGEHRSLPASLAAKCPLCLGLHHVSGLLPSATPFPGLALVDAPQASVPHAVAPRLAAHHLPEARAPPAA